MRLILILLFFATNATAEVTTAPLLGTASSGDSIIAIDASAEAGSKIKRIVFDGNAATALTGAGTFVTPPGNQTAADVPITDAGGLITATDVEGALAEHRTAINLNTAKVTNTDAQTLSFTTPNLTISGGNSVDISSSSTDQLTFHADGGGAAITTGLKTCYPVEYAATITSARAMCDQSGSIVVDIWKDIPANYQPTDADSITAAAPVTISASNYSLDSTLTGWTTAISSGDILCYNVDSAATVQWCTVTLKVTK